MLCQFLLLCTLVASISAATPILEENYTEENYTTYYNYYSPTSEPYLAPIEPNAISYKLLYTFLFDTGNCSASLATTNSVAYALGVKNAYLLTLATYGSGITIPAEDVQVVNVVCETPSVPDGGLRRKLATTYSISQDVEVNAQCSALTGVACDQTGLTLMLNSSINSASDGTLGTNLAPTTGPIASTDTNVVQASLAVEPTAMPTVTPTLTPTMASTYAYMCLWATGCDTTSADKMCEPGSYCQVNQYWSQCLEMEEEEVPSCYATNNGPYGGQRWGCTSDAQCCNPSATCGSDSLCHLQCKHENGAPTMPPTAKPTVLPTTITTSAPSVAPVVAPTMMPVAVVIPPTMTPVVASSALWGQCGGKNWEGPTTCVSGSVCAYSNKFYSQCKPSSTSNYADLWGQCGGSNWNGATMCVSGSSCEVKNVWYSQCKPVEVPATAAPTIATTMAPVATVALWGQCGGQNWKGDTTCTAGAVCLVKNKWYSQCKPGVDDSSAAVDSESRASGGATITFLLAVVLGCAFLVGVAAAVYYRMYRSNTQKSVAMPNHDEGLEFGDVFHDREVDTTTTTFGQANPIGGRV